MISRNSAFVFWYFCEGFLAVLLFGKNQLNVAVIDFLGPNKAWKDLFSDLETDFVFSVKDDLRGKYFDSNVKIFFYFTGWI